MSQTNPWVVPLLSEDGWDESVQFRTYKNIKRLFLMEFRHWVRILNYFNISESLTTFLGIFTQENRGHVTIWPVPSIKDYTNILNNPAAKDIQSSVHKGMLRTFPKMNMLKAILKIEKTFDSCYDRIKALINLTYKLN